MAEKVRVHTLAKELNVSSKDILSKCQAEGIDVKNHMSTLGAGLEATVREWFSEGAHVTTVERTERVDVKKLRRKRKAKEERDKARIEATTETVAEAQLEGAPTVEQEEQVAADEAVETAPAAVMEKEEAQESRAEKPDMPTTLTTVSTEEKPIAVAADEEPAAEAVAVTEAAEAVARTEEVDEPVTDAAAEVAVTDEAGAGVEEEAAAEAPAEEESAPPQEPVRPAGPQNVPLPAKLSGPRVVRYEAPEEYIVPKRGPRRRPSPVEDEPGVPEAPAAGGAKGRGGRRRGGAAAEEKGGPRKGVERRRAKRVAEVEEKLTEWNDQDLAERRERLRGATGRRMSARRAAAKKGGGQATQAQPITRAQVEEPITVKQLCSAIGVPFQRMFPVLAKEHKMMLSLTSIITKDIAELVAATFGVELAVVEAKTGLDRLKEEYLAIERKNLTTRPPIVTVLGHVDHGKTSLLDRIRRARVAEREDGGITQHISSSHYRKDNVAVTFLDTPGHEAFTALRARGAQLTDVVVLVIAADDGIMPQTVEAINHAKAAGVPIVVALNKIDLGTQNITKIYSQLSERGLTPSGDWGGEVDVIHTSAITGEGVDSLLEHLSTLAEVLDLKADPTVPACGTVVEAESRQGVGPVLQVIVREGTIRVGDTLVCGNSFGKVRALHDDTGKSIQEVGPSMPAEIWGMNDVPSSGDMFFQVDNMQRAKEIGEEVSHRRRMDARAGIKKARTLDDLVKQRTDADVTELNVIIRADVDGSVDVLTHSLTQFPSDEVKLVVLHAGIGAVTDSDVHLADASNAIIIAFRVATPPQTKRLAEEKSVDIREYKVIYDVTDDIKKALEGLLTPDEVVEERGRAEVREVFRVSKVGLVAGSYVRDGNISVNHVARVVRDGAIVRDKCKFNSLRRFKDDVKEVRHGMECGIRLEGFDDIKVGDIIETFEIVKVARTLG